MIGRRFGLAVLIAVSAHLTIGVHFSLTAQPGGLLASSVKEEMATEAQAGPQSSPGAGSGEPSSTEQLPPPNVGGGTNEDPAASPGCRLRNNRKLELIV
jgi:hypothetical protein